MPQHIMNIANVELRSSSHGEKYASSVGAIGVKIGAKKLGYNLTVVPPGKRAYPAHNHRVNEELFFILEGEGEVRIGNERFPIKKGDAICCPPGGPEVAHQIINTGTTTMRYLALSTIVEVESASIRTRRRC